MLRNSQHREIQIWFSHYNTIETRQKANNNMGISHVLIPLLVLITLSLTGLVCGNTELRALLDLKASLDPENKLLQSWTENGDPCSGSFEGIACNEHRKVANISLQGKGLTGNLSPALSGLKCLSGLYLHYNNLSGGIPKEIGNLTELTDLYLDVNNLFGKIPPEIGNMAALQGQLFVLVKMAYIPVVCLLFLHHSYGLPLYINVSLNVIKVIYFPSYVIDWYHRLC